MALGRGAIKRHFIRINIAQKTKLPGAKRLHAIGVGFGDIARAVDLIVHHHQRALATRHGCASHPDGIQQIQRAIRADRRRRTL